MAKLALRDLLPGYICGQPPNLECEAVRHRQGWSYEDQRGFSICHVKFAFTAGHSGAMTE